MRTSTPKFLIPLVTLLALAAPATQAQSLTTHAWTLLRPAATGPKAGASRRTQATVVRPGQVLAYSWDFNTPAWSVPIRTAYTYNAQGLVTQEVNGDSARTMVYDRNQYVYNGQGQLTEVVYQLWNGSAWLNQIRTQNSYDAQGQLTQSLYQGWNGTGWYTRTGYQSIYRYDASGVLLEQIDQVLQDGTFVNQVRTVFTLQNGQWDTSTTQTWKNDAWQNMDRVVDIVWADWNARKVASFRIQGFAGGSFTDQERVTVTYGTNGNSTEIRQHYTGTAWENFSRYSELYDSNGNSLETLADEWRGTAWEKVFGTRSLLKYAPNNAVQRKVNQHYNAGTKEYVNDALFTYADFQTITLPNRNAALTAQTTLYPNPTTGLATLQVAELSEAATGEVRNSLGQLVHTFQVLPHQGQLQQPLDLSTLPAGVYTVRLLTTQGSVVKQLVRH